MQPIDAVTPKFLYLAKNRFTFGFTFLVHFSCVQDIHGGAGLSDHADFTLEIMSYVGVCLSIAGLLITTLTYLFNK